MEPLVWTIDGATVAGAHVSAVKNVLDGKIDVDFEKKIRLAQMMLDEDKWNLEKEERQANMVNAKGEQDILRQMLSEQQPQQEQPQIPPMSEEPPLQ